jgi:hypothetical protein
LNAWSNAFAERWVRTVRTEWHLTTRETNRLTPTQAQTVIAAAILRQLHAVITTGHAWDPDIATGGAEHRRAYPSPPEPRSSDRTRTVGASPPRH